MSDTTYITSLENLYEASDLPENVGKVSILLRDGSNQEQRLSPALNPNYIKIDEKTTKDFLLFFYKFSKHIYFYKPNYVSNSDWSSFFALFEGLEEDTSGERWKKVQKQIENGGSVSPHMGLLITFLHLFRYAQNHINTITERHLVYYYRDVLCFKERPAQPDRVHIIVELAKNTDYLLIEKGVLFGAGNDSTDTPVFYSSERETAINKAEVTQLKSIFIDKNREKNVYRIYAIQKANTQDGVGEPLAKEQSFLPFHQGLYTPQSTEESIRQKEAAIGFAISSPVLRLAEGTRTIAVEICFGIGDIEPRHPDYAEKYAEMQQFWKKVQLVKSNFKISLSTEKEWFQKKIDDISLLPNEGVLTLYAYLSPNDPPITAYQSAVLGENYPEGEPIIKIHATPQYERPLYEVFGAYPVQKIQVSVAVERVGHLYLQNDISAIETGKPFEPFGSQPQRNAALYISSPEAFIKQIDALGIHFNWKNLPDDFADYYDAYPGLRNKPFKVAISFLQDRQWLPILDEQNQPLTYQLFAQQNDRESIQIDKTRLALKGNPSPIRPNDQAIEPTWNTNTNRGYLKMELIEPRDAFGHAVYANLYADRLTDKLFKKSAQMLQLATQPAAANDKKTDPKQASSSTNNFIVGDDEIELPNLPYSPVIEQLSLSYSASQTLYFDKKQPNHPKNLFFHLHPFGQAPTETAENTYLLPAYIEQGSLYIGIEKLQVPQNISLLFQLAEGSGNPDLAIPTIQWYYLSNDQWIIFDRNDILTDTTTSLMNTGIIVFKMPAAATRNNNIMPEGCHWIKMSVNNNVLALNQIISIQAQAISAVFIDNNNDPNRLKQPLPPNSIKELAVSDTRIKSIEQPYSSFDGKIAEQGNDFYARVSERLRHKNRAISIWDYERIVLAHFNSIYKVKCLPHTGPKSDFAPGCVTLVTIPNLRNKNAVNRLQPKTPLNLLKAIKEYIGQYASPFVRIDVQNPIYEEILVSFEVGFLTGYDIGLYVERLNEAIKQYLSPWAYEANEDIIFGGRINKSSIINFIEEIEYVDYVNNFVLYHKYRQDNEIREEATDEAEARSTRSILVSAEQHRINPWKEGELAYIVPEGIGHMLIEINFEIFDED